MNSFYELIKKLLKTGVIGVIIAAITLICTILFGYSQYAKTKGQKISPIIQEKIEETKEHNCLIIRTNDTIKLLNPPLCQSFRNTSKYTINNLFIETTVICPIKQQVYSFYLQSDEFKPYSQRIIGDMLHTTYTYKAESLFPNETTVPFVKEYTMIPQHKDALGYIYYYIKSKVQWDGQSPIEYVSTVNYKYVDDDYNVDHPILFSNKQDSIKYKSWLKRVVNEIKGHIPDYNLDLILAYHSYLHLDSFPEKNIIRGASVGYFDMNNLNIDSIVDPSMSFIQRHDYSFDHKKFIVVYDKSDVGFGLFLVLIFLIAICLGNRLLTGSLFESKVIYFLALTVLFTLSYCFLRRWLVHINVLGFYEYNKSWFIPLIGLLIISGSALFYVILILKEFLVGFFKTPKSSRKQFFYSEIKNVLTVFFFLGIVGGLLAGIHYDAMNSILKYPLPL